MTNMTTFHARDTIILKALLRTYAPDSEVWEYGSAPADEQANRQLDIVLRNPLALDTPHSGLSVLRDAIDSRDLSCRIKSHDWAVLSEPLRRQMASCHVVIIPAAKGIVGPEQSGRVLDV